MTKGSHLLAGQSRSKSWNKSVFYDKAANFSLSECLWLFVNSASSRIKEGNNESDAICVHPQQLVSWNERRRNRQVLQASHEFLETVFVWFAITFRSSLSKL